MVIPGAGPAHGSGDPWEVGTQRSVWLVESNPKKKDPSRQKDPREDRQWASGHHLQRKVTLGQVAGMGPQGGALAFWVFPWNALRGSCREGPVVLGSPQTPGPCLPAGDPAQEASGSLSGAGHGQ